MDSKAQVDAQNKRAPRDAMPYNVCCWSLVAADNQLMETEGGFRPVHDYSSKTSRSGLEVDVKTEPPSMILEVAFFMADETTEKAEKPIDTSVKARYWWAVLYQENMVDGWRDNIEELLQLPYAYCEHVADVDGKGEHRKDHVHVIIVFGNTTTYKTAMSVFKRLGEKALNKCERVIDIRHCYDYLIHDTDKCRKLGKHQYDPSERITGNGFDIGNYEQISTAEKQHMLKELTWFIMSEGYETINEFTQPALERFGEQYWEIMVSYSAFLVKYLNGNKMMREKAEMQKRLAWEEAMRERCRNNEADSHSGE